MFPHPRENEDVQYMQLNVYNMCRTHLSTLHIKNAHLILFHSVNMSILTLFIYLWTQW